MMAKIIRREVRKRGFFGWVFLMLFFAFNILMLAWLVAYWTQLANITEVSEAARTGKAIGGTLASGFLLFLWGMGAVILGLLAILTRGSKRIIEETQ
jgi:NADH:ubiquinone oxidoreductase subunit 6 (subunit J)